MNEGEFDELLEASTLGSRRVKAVIEAGRMFHVKHPPDEEPVMEYCQNCQSTYKDTPEERRHHIAPCYRCGSDGHSPCQH